MHSARLLESLSSNADFAAKFVEQGGLQLLLRLYTLRHLPATFGSSAAAHALVAAVRVLNQSAASPATASKVVEAVTGAAADHPAPWHGAPNRKPSNTTPRNSPKGDNEVAQCCYRPGPMKLYVTVTPLSVLKEQLL